MTGLPPPTNVSIGDAVRFVARQTGASKAKAQNAIRDAAMAGLLDFFGFYPLNAHPDAATASKRAAEFRQRKLDAADWPKVDWKLGTSGRLSSIYAAKLSLERWLSSGGPPSEPGVPDRKPPRQPTPSDYNQLIEYGEAELSRTGMPPTATDYEACWNKMEISRSWVRIALSDSKKASWKHEPFPARLKRLRGERSGLNKIKSAVAI